MKPEADALCFSSSFPFSSINATMILIVQMANSDEELKKNEGGTPDAIDNALAFGEGPAKEMFGVELSKP